MPANSVSTGITGLDADLQVLSEANATERRRDIKAAIANTALSEEELFDVVPHAILRLALTLREPSSYKALVKKVDEQARPRLEKAKEIIDQHFADILKHPSVLHLFSLPDDEEEPSILETLNIIGEVNHRPGWIGVPPNMRPSSRLVFFGMDGRPLLDSTCDWYDFLYLIQTISSILICEMESGKALNERRLVDLPDKDDMLRRLQILEENVKKLKELTRLYSLTTSAQEPDKDEGEQG